MKRKEITETRNKDVKSLKKMAYDLRSSADKVHMDIRAGKTKNLKSLKNLRRDLAQTLTIIREKEILEKFEVKKEGGKI